MLQSSPVLSVVIPTHRRADSVAEVLKALDKQTLAPEKFEVVVVQDGEWPETTALLENARHSYALRHFSQPAKGAPAARNLGVANARGEYLVFLDDDILCQPQVLELYYKTFTADDSKQLLIGTFAPAPNTPYPLVQQIGDISQRHGPRVSQPGYIPIHTDVPDGNMAARKRDIVEVGGWDPRFTGVGGDDDSDLAWRMLEKGARIRFIPGAIGYHYWVKDWLTMIDQRREIGAVHVHFAQKNPEVLRDLLFTQFAGGHTYRRYPALMTPYVPEFVYQAVRAMAKAFPGRRLPVGNPLLLTLMKWSIWAFYMRGFYEASPDLARAVCEESGKAVASFAFHRVAPDAKPGCELTVTPERFDQYLRVLRQFGYEAISLEQFVAWQRRLAPLPNKPVFITFDDGYAGFAEHALPVLKRHGYTATVFVTTQGMERRPRSWKLPYEPMQPEEIAAVAAAGIGIGAHTVNHPDLTKCSAEELRCELKCSAEALERVTGRRPVAFSYTHGLHDAAVRDAVREAGFEAAMTSRFGRNGLYTDALQLRRVFLNEHTESWRMFREFIRPVEDRRPR